MSFDPGRARDLFLAAAELPPDRRPDFLAGSCGCDAELRAEVERLLAAHAAPASVLEPPVRHAETGEYSPGAGRAAETPTADHSPDPGTVTHGEAGAGSDRPPGAVAGTVLAGRYTLVEEIGAGGMGAVWVAKQTEPVKRRVAVKLIKAGMDSRAVLARFEAERQALALMDHPNIAKVLDAGVTPAGGPFFVMELVNGLPLTQFCDRMTLSPRERLELFVPICQAVQHAHQKGVVHRDLKPGNILVTMIDGRPVPKVIDFGVAKATGERLTDESMATQFGAVIGTLEYMAPEQAGLSGVDVDTRADVYSLGVILYELLTGLRPIDADRLKTAALAEMIRLVREEEPSKPSTRLSTAKSLPSLAALRQTEPKKLMALLRGELDWVVMKCLEKQRDRRYETANALARDVQRYLADEPVEARPPSAGYRLRKLVRRNRAAVLTVALVAASLLVGIAAAVWQAALARRAEDQEREAKNRAENLATANARLAADEAGQRRAAEAARGEAQNLAAANAKLAADEREAKERALLATEEKVRQLRRSRENLFTAQMTRVNQTRETDPTRAFQLLHDLAACPIELRDAAWRFSENACLRRTVARIPETATAQALSPDGTLLAVTRFRTDPATRRPADFVALVEVPGGKVRTSLPPEPDGIRDVAFGPDGTRLAVVVGRPQFPGAPAKPGTVVIWDVASDKKLATLSGHKEAIHAVAFSPDGKVVATAGKDGTAKVWDAATGELRHTLDGHTKEVRAVAFSPDGKRLATGSLDNTVKLWDSATWELRSTATAATNTTPEYLSLVEATVEGTAKLGDRERTFDGVTAVDFSPDGRTLAVGNVNWQLELVDAASGQSRLIVRGRGDPVSGVRFHPDGRSVFTAGESLNRWDATTGQQMLTIPNSRTLSLSRDGRRVSHALGGQVEIIDPDAPLERAVGNWELGDPGSKLLGGVSTPTGDGFALVSGNIITLWDSRALTLRKTLAGHTRTVTALAMSPDGTILASASSRFDQPGEEGKGDPVKDPVRLWDVRTGEPAGTIPAHAEYVSSLAYSPDGGTLVVATQERLTNGFLSRFRSKLALVGASGRAPVATVESPEWGSHPGPCLVQFAPDGRTFAVAAGEHIGVWDAAGRKRVRGWKMAGMECRAERIAYSPDGKTLAVASSNLRETVIDLWDPHTGERVGLLATDTASPITVGTTAWIGPRGRMSLAFSPDGRTLASTGGKEGVRLWNVETAQLRAALPGGPLSDTPFVAFGRDGHELVSAGQTGGKPEKVKGSVVQLRSWNVAPSDIVTLFPSGYAPHFGADGRSLILLDDQSLKVWDLPGRRVRLTVPTVQASGQQLASRPDGEVLAIGGSTGTATERRIALMGGPADNLRGVIEFMDLRTGKIFDRVEIGPGPIYDLQYSSDGKRLALLQYESDGKGGKPQTVVSVWDVPAARAVSTFRFGTEPTFRRGTALRFHPEGQLLAVGCHEGSVLLHDVSSGAVKQTLVGKAAPLYMSFTEDGIRLVVHFFRRDPKTTPPVVWDWRAGKAVEDEVPDYLSDRSVSPDGRYELVNDPTGIRLIDRTRKAPAAGAASRRP